MHDIKLKHLSPLEDLVHILLVQGDDQFVVTTLPRRVAALLDNIGLKVSIFTDHSTHLRDLKLHVCVGWLHFIHRVEQAHRRDYVD